MPLALGVVIVAHNSGDVLPECLRRLDRAVTTAATHLRGSAHVVVVDNRSETPVAAPGGLDALTVQVLRREENLGFPRAVNLGLRLLDETDAVLLLNPDAWLHPSALERLLHARERDGAALVGPLLVGDDDRPNGASERPFHSLGRELLQQLAPFALASPAAGEEARRTGRARCLTGACLLVDAELLRSLGGLDQMVPMYLEDVELCWSTHARGLPVVFAADARCLHALGGSSRGSSFKRTLKLYLTLLSARVEFVGRRRGSVAAAAMRGIMAVGAAARCAVSIARGDRRQAARQARVVTWAIASGKPPAWRDGNGRVDTASRSAC